MPLLTRASPAFAYPLPHDHILASDSIAVKYAFLSVYFVIPTVVLGYRATRWRQTTYSLIGGMVRRPDADGSSLQSRNAHVR